MRKVSLYSARKCNVIEFVGLGLCVDNLNSEGKLNRTAYKILPVVKSMKVFLKMAQIK